MCPVAVFIQSGTCNLEEKALGHARSGVHALADPTPKTALVKQDNREFEILAEQVTLEDVVIVHPGVRIPVDGRIISVM